MRPSKNAMIIYLVFAAVMISAGRKAPQSAPKSLDIEPAFKSVAPSVDPPSMLRRHLIREAVEDLNAGAVRREKMIGEKQVAAYSQSIREQVREFLGEMPYGSRGGALHVRAVSKYKRNEYAIENVIFESFPGWEVNASVYLPAAEKYPPPWIPVVMPVGHNSKTAKEVQFPAQVFARCGYLVITFDPPMFGEKQVGNDHFNDGVRCYLTGMTSERFFLMDALRAIDYVATRKDVDMSHGVGMTGVSGGGLTTLYCTLLDNRIKVAAPSCFTSADSDNPVRNEYAMCPEDTPIGRYQEGIDTADLVIAAHPVPLLLMAGRLDKLFLPEWSQGVADEVAKAYAAGDLRDHFTFFLDDSPHFYTVAQALHAVHWMDRWVRGVSGRELPKITTQDVEVVPDEVLQCHPRTDVNMFSLNRQEAERLAKTRGGVFIRAAAMKLVGVSEENLSQLKPQRVESATPVLELTTHDTLDEMMLDVDNDIQLPATMLYDPEQKTRVGAVLYFDERGRWTDLASGGMLGAMAHLTRAEGPKPVLLTVDLRGWGETSPANGPYDVFSWASPHRWVAYLSAALGDPVLGMRVRDGIAALAYLRSRPEVDPQRIVVGGYGMGGVVAMHVAEIDGHVHAVLGSGILSSFQALAESSEYAWNHEAFMPNVLKSYDLPELVADLGVAILIVNPLDAVKRPVSLNAAKQLYSAAISNKNFELHSELPEPQAQKTEINWVEHQW